ncbi:5-amino-6-(D-ribitylamino)uracil--L-tyrosine 4-hydroxyphenyl transferase CofH [Methanomethylovorans sp.]|uniref:5-amino-6-(D-ribitylamino)uracil--L-tyrosine 4-hydroxyphenyl transferase CofH n=1 Tax=Methanomethylovorans sp. TaxID=2758717 RepID=UPI00351C0069
MQSFIPEDTREKAYQGEITPKDALDLMELAPLALFNFADQLHSNTVGDVVTYVVNRNIYITNMCRGNCGFCAYRSEKGFMLDMDQILEKVSEASEAGAVEVCIQGGFLPQLDIDYYTSVVENIKEAFPKISIHGFSPMEIFYACESTGISPEEAFLRLKAAGLDTLTGTSAEILSDRVRKIICPGKLSTDQWINTIMAAHQAGLRTNSTIMYGHVETLEERLNHLFILRSIQQKTGGFTELVPLPFMPYNNPVGENMLSQGKFMTMGIKDLRFYAMARIILNGHINNIQASWVKLGKKLCQVALHCGANDLGGTLMEDKISTASGSTNGEYVPPAEIEWIIRSSGRVPQQRNALYEGV